MELRLVILSVACFSCLIPSALSLNLLAAKAVASQTALDIAEIGAQTLAAKKAAVANAATDISAIASQIVALKGQAMKKAASSIAGAMFNGATSIGSTIAKAGLNMVLAKFGIRPSLVAKPTFVFQTPVLQEEVVEEVKQPVVVEYDQAVEVPAPIPPISTVSVEYRPPLVNLPPPPQLSSDCITPNEAVPSVEVMQPAYSPLVYEIVETPQVFTGPLMETFRYGK